MSWEADSAEQSCGYTTCAVEGFGEAKPLATSPKQEFLGEIASLQATLLKATA
jgi:hypothetical protein